MLISLVAIANIVANIDAIAIDVRGLDLYLMNKVFDSECLSFIDNAATLLITGKKYIFDVPVRPTVTSKGLEVFLHHRVL